MADDFDKMVDSLIEEVMNDGGALTRFMPDGTIRGVWSDDFDSREAFGVMPFRASQIDVIEEGEHKGKFFVSFHPLADRTGNKFFRCQFAPFSKYEEARRFEVAWLLRNWVLSRE